MAVNKFSMSIQVEGQESEPKQIQYDLRLPKKLKKMASDEMCDWVREQVKTGKDVYGRTYAPKADGTPATLIRTGKLLDGIVESQWLNYWSKNEDIAVVGITHILDTYPWVLNAGVNPRKHIFKQSDKIMGKIKRKLDRRARKIDQLSQTSDLTNKWKKIQDTIMAIDGDLRELRQLLIDVENQHITGLPARQWWGLADEKRDRVYAALRGWLTTLIDGVVANACNPQATTIQQADDAAQAAFVQGLRTGVEQ